MSRLRRGTAGGRLAVACASAAQRAQACAGPGIVCPSNSRSSRQAGRSLRTVTPTDGSPSAHYLSGPAHIRHVLAPVALASAHWMQLQWKGQSVPSRHRLQVHAEALQERPRLLGEDQGAGAGGGGSLHLHDLERLGRALGGLACGRPRRWRGGRGGDRRSERLGALRAQPSGVAAAEALAM